MILFEAKMRAELRPVIGYQNYFVSDDGKIFSKAQSKEPKEMKCEKMKLGYMRAHLRSSGVSKKVLLHVLVANAFVPNPNAKKEINHKDGNKENNAASNLEWVTRAENMRHARNMVLMKPMRGEMNPIAVLTEAKVREIRDALKQPYRGIVVALAKKYGVVPEAISNIRHGKNWKHVE